MSEFSDRPPELPPMSGDTGNRVLIGAAAAAIVISNIAIVAEALTDRWLARGLGFPAYLSLPLAFGAAYLAFRVWQKLDRRIGQGLLVGAAVYWVVLVVDVLN
ncbi:hypothetical protein FRD01_18015 [Microvenator marinus]|uniref:Uncharacterized protein n=1 Tax=Microvenator marinus TaxID=2600177 RepID=A0A5B8XTZ8_9DELT|nr:hypothetical protein [Microvenator marinus]QED29100.1 hypothetical protein FRD01_18015 [Microvenator marinus]